MLRSSMNLLVRLRRALRVKLCGWVVRGLRIIVLVLMVYTLVVLTMLLLRIRVD